MKQTSLSFTRYGESDTDDNGYEVLGVTSTIPSEGSLQPLSSGESQRIQASGVETFAAYKYYTSTKLQMADDVDRTTADTVMIDSRKYEVFDSGNWDKTVLRNVAHYKVILVRVGKKRGN
tara:strand:- start:38 stop:397 length:360 start_codon:yes stop_codon:yes gene_type:complete